MSDPPPGSPTPSAVTANSRPAIPFGRVVAGGLVLLFLAGLAGWFIAQPTDESFSAVDAGFLADMTDHHQGAINLGFAYLHNEHDLVIGNMARSIVTDQSQEIGIMNSLLTDAGSPATIGDGLAMDWMGASVPSSEMPGLATQAQFDELRAATGLTADDLFTRLMIRHHAAGVTMAEYAAVQGENERARRFARGVAHVQRGEITDMNLRRTALGLAPIEPDFSVAHAHG
jgi:uncharacterized protein (DUF305 family)